MSAWKKQAVPLVFLEIAMDAVLKTNGHNRAVRRIDARVRKWLAEAWKPLNERTGRIDDTAAHRQTIAASKAISDALTRIWGDGGMKTPSELPSAMLVITEDKHAQLPRTNKDRRKAWERLIAATYELCLVADPELVDNEGQERGVMIANIVMREAA